MASPQSGTNVATVYDLVSKWFVYSNHLNFDKATKTSFDDNVLRIVDFIRQDRQLQLLLEDERMSDAFDRIIGLLRNDNSGVSHAEHETDDARLSSFNRQVHNTQLAWKQEYIGQTHAVFDQVLIGCESSFNPVTHYARYMPIVQSSGAGKSRLIDFHSTIFTGICYTLRWDDHSGYPPGDPEVTQFLTTKYNPIVEEQTMAWNHAKFIALFAATINQGKSSSNTLVYQ